MHGILSNIMETIIFTDGASRGNPGPGGWGTVVVIGDSVKELGGRNDSTTNNRMELQALVEAFQYIEEKKDEIGIVTVYTDSQYAINGITMWVHGWKKNDWKTKVGGDVLNKDIWERLDVLVGDLEVEWKAVRGHAGVPGNERCDEIATAYADSKNIDLYDGSRDAYTVDINKLDEEAVSSTKKDRSKQKAYSYLSMIDGDIQKHATWAECEARVKGKSGTRFRKSVSPEDEAEIIAEWNKK